MPVLAISGDDAAVKEARRWWAGVEGAVVKWALGFHSARTLTPEAAREMIREAVRQGMAPAGGDQALPGGDAGGAWRSASRTTGRPRCWASCPESARADAHAVRLTARDMPEAARILSFITQYQPNLEP